LDGASKEIVQLQRDVALLQQQVNDLQQSVDRGNAVLKTLIEQSADSVNRMGTTIKGLEESVQTAMGQNGIRVNSLETQVAALRDAVDEMGARFGRVSQQLAETQSVMQSVDARLAATTAPPATGPPATGSGTPPQPVAGTPERNTGSTPVPTPTSTPSADALYNAALRDFNSGNYELASQQFNDYINYYRDTELAGNAQYYLGEIEYQQKKYQSAILQYDKVLNEHPGSYKTAASYLKKGYALLALNQRDEAVTFLRLVVEKFPRWDEADLARSRLRRMGETVPQ
jgi:tol-pal system protein YbgF